MSASDAEQIVRNFMKTIFEGDTKAKSSLVTDDIVFVNGSKFTINGREEFEKLFEGSSGRVHHLNLEVIALLASDDMVMVERVDNAVVDGIDVRLPIMGTYELRDGLVCQWRDYFDPTISPFKGNIDA